MSKLTDKSLQLFRQLAELKNIKRAFSELFVRNGLGSDSDRFADYPDAVQQMVDTANANVESAQAETAATKDELTSTRTQLTDTQTALTTAQKEATTTYTSLKSTVSAKGVDVSAATDSNGVISALKTSVITPLGQIGYTPEDEAVYADLTFEPGTWEDDMAYSLTCYKNNKQSYDGDTSIRFAPQISGLSGYCANAFRGCTNLETVPSLDTSKVTNVQRLFMNCSKLKAVPWLNLSKNTQTNSMFYNCSSLTSVPTLDTHLSGNFQCMFYGCSSLEEAPELDTSSALPSGGLNQLFEGCTSLKRAPSELYIENQSGAYATFKNCSSLEEVPPLNTKSATTIGSLFYGCTSLKRVPQVDFSSLTNTNNYLFANCKSLVYMVITNLGKSSFENYTVFSTCPVWGTGGDENRQSVVDSLLTYSYDRAANGMTTATIQLSAATKALLTDEEVAAITAKGFTLA
jgi:surface protein